MSKNPEPLEIEKCVSSRLWYTASAILNSTDNSYTSEQLEQIHELINAALDSAENRDQHEWILHNILLGLDKQNTGKIKKKLEILQFFANLKLISTDIPEKVKKELFDLFEAISSAKSISKISPSTVQFIEASLNEKPALTCWLINNFLNSPLQDLYSNFLKNSLESTEINLAAVLCVLSKFNIPDSKEDELISWLFPCLFKTCNQDEIELSLYSRKKPKFLKEWHVFLDNQNYRNSSVSDVESAKKISDVLFTSSGDSNEICLQPKELSLRAIRRDHHWFLDILDICSILIESKEYERVTRILSSPVLSNIWPILLIHFLHNLPFDKEETWEKSIGICESIKFMLNKCRSVQYESTNEPVLLNLNASLTSNLKVVEWILEYKKKNLVEHQNNTRVKSILDGLQESCIISVLKKSIDLHECSYEEVKELIKDDDELKVLKAYHSMRLALRAEYDDFESVLNTINPLSVRLELIENVFSMLFLRHDGHFGILSEEEGYESTSNYSKADTSKLKYGFVCDKNAVRKLLKYLRRCIVQVGIDFGKLRRSSSTDLKNLEGLQSRILAIDSSVTDAYWRLEILTSQEFVEGKDDDFETSLSDDKLTLSFRLKSKSIFYNQQLGSSSEENDKSSDNTDPQMSSEASSSTDVVNSKRRKRTRNFYSGVRYDNSKYIVNLMLASKESLLMLCLWRGDYSRARQVIEMFKMKNTSLDGLVGFSKAMRNFRLEMTKQTNSSEPAPSSLGRKTKDFQAFESLRRTAQGSYQSSRLANLLETFVSSQEKNARLLSTENLDSRDLVTLCVLDFGLTMSLNSHQASLSLLDVAAKYLKLSSQKLNTAHAAYFNELYRLFQAVGEDKKSVPALLCDASVPLKLQEWRDETEFWRKLKDKVKMFLESQSVLDKGDSAELAGQIIFDEIIEICGNERTYLHNLREHLKILHSILPDDEKSSMNTESSLLSNSIDSYFGHQIFDLNVEPESLEAVASKLGVSLVHNILVNCCPKLTCHEPPNTAKSDTWGCFILNDITDQTAVGDSGHQDPNQLVADILSELLLIIKRLYPNRTRILNKDLIELYNSPEIQVILSKSTRLENLDLSELSVGEHTLAFFLNLWNLAFLHTQLQVWRTEPPVNPLRKFISMSTINYRVGDLGRISLGTLRHKLLGSASWDTEFFFRTEDLNELAWQDLELTTDPRVIFAMANEFHETPAIRVYHPQTLNKDLNQGLYDYLETYSKKEFDNTSNDEEVRKIIIQLPKIVEGYEKSPNVNLSTLNSTSLTINQLYQTTFSHKTDRRYEPVTSTYEILLKYDKTNVTPKLDVGMRQSLTATSSWTSRSIKPNVLHYLENHCWLLSYLVKRIHKNGSSSLLESGCDNVQRTACLDNVTASPWIATLASALFDDNLTLASIQENLSLVDLWTYFERCLDEDRLGDCLEVINALPSKLFTRCTEIQCLKDYLLCQLVHKKGSNEVLGYVYQIKDVNALVQTVLASLNSWPVELCKSALHYVLHHVDKEKLPAHCSFKINETLCRVTVFHKILPYCKSSESNCTWRKVQDCTQKTDPLSIVQSLIEAEKFELCLEWLEYQAFSTEIQSLVTPDLLIGLLKNDESDYKNARKLLSALPTRQSMKMCKSVIKKLDSIRPMRFISEYLLERCEPGELVAYQKIQMGVNILEQLEPKDRAQYTPLIKEPLLMLEQCLMNCKFESLRKILVVLQRSESLSKAKISIENFDKVVRFYAGKSLDFRVCLQRDGIDPKIRDSTSSAATSSDNESRTSEFVMPVNVPTKEEWVPNEKARECSCCKAVIFSMFNRRHHCRRCGRVICAACSQQRMQVPTYPKSVLVRICDDCKIQTIRVQAQVAPSAASSVLLESWKLTTDERHNRTVREEFSFEYAPNISLCLAILSLHSDHKAYASFLLDRCDEMKSLLQPLNGGRVNPEVDHGLIIKMIRSLLVAAKVKCAKLGLNSGLAHCDRFLSQVDLVATLVQSDCLALIPSDDSLDEHALRKLRDLLTEKEQWTLALDVSTKSGLDTQGVWAAWGKACLKAGYFDRARTKFSHCMEKIHHDNFDDWVLVSIPDTYSDSPKSLDSPSNRKRQIGAKTRPAKDPPLLLEILQILENQSQLNPDFSMQSKANLAQEILTTLNTLKAVSQGQCSLVHRWDSPRSIYYEESLYYLLTFGSFNSILDFFVKHREFQKCLAFVLENKVDPELFFNAVYSRCLNSGSVDELLATMKTEDASLMTWKKYLVYTCHSLDKKQYHNSLYHLQLFMRDYIRAAMTCIHFYTSDARNYIDLNSSSHHLLEAQKHLETELNANNLGRRKKSVSSVQSFQGSLTMEMEPSEIDKHVTTISRQLEVAKFLANAERDGRAIGPYLKHLVDVDTGGDELPTLFGNHQQKTRLAVLTILCGNNAEDGFGIAFRIIQDYNLRPQKVYSLAGHVLALENKVGFIEQLVKCCRSSGAPDSQDISDRVLTHCVKLLLQNPQTESNPEFKDRVDSLIRLINDVELKISSYIESKQLKAAYLLAVKHQRAQDIRKILKEADRLGQNAIRSICAKWLKQTQNPT